MRLDGSISHNYIILSDEINKSKELYQPNRQDTLNKQIIDSQSFEESSILRKTAKADPVETIGQQDYQFFRRKG
jgi:hypothetical protein